MDQKNNERYSNARMRKDIYEYLEEQGFEMTKERHEEIKLILGMYETQRMVEMNDKLSIALNRKQ